MRSALIALAALAQLTLSVAADDFVKIPLYRRSSDGVVTAAGKALDNGVLAGTVNIGNPPQEFTVAFDTSSGYSWVRGSRCKSTNCLDRCTYYARNSNSSVPTGKKFSVKYGDNCVDTHIYYDTWEFAGITVHNQPFGGAYRMSGFSHGFDGYLGLGPNVNLNTSKLVLAPSTGRSSLAKRDGGASGFVPNAYQTGAGVGSNQFGVYTSGQGNGMGAPPGGSGTNPPPPPPANTTTTAPPPPRSASQPQPDGFLVIGGVDTSAIKGNITYFDVDKSKKGHDKGWDICISHVGIGKLGLKQQEGAIAAISTSSPYIVMPDCQADEFKKTFGGKFYKSKGTYSVKCSEIKDLPALKLDFLGKVVELPAKYWTREIDGDRDCCEVLLSKGASPTDWILGAPFTNAFYTTFDATNEQVGLAITATSNDPDLKIYDL
ncbi:acid protease [Hesseltinella vesiculosa]|uniref:Acid protease n=1 Tax=Hesseltinella vesiculosa TaxID=101127 RepID=A0A1X2GN88_9FUNG|nr:acid protease [Hesseltinella vesiculosa]